MIRAVFAALVGVTVTVALAYAALVVMLVATVGLPLGSQPRSPGATEYAVMLVGAAAAAAIGTKASLRLAEPQPQIAVRCLAVMLPLIMLWGFFGSSGWPPWWGGALACAMVAGVFTAGRRSLI